MIDFKNSSMFKLKVIDHQEVKEGIRRFLTEDEQIIAAFKTIRDQVVFTNKRVIAANVQGITGSKVDYTSLPYNKVNAFSVESAGSFDMDCELVLYIGEVGEVKFELRGSFDIVGFNYQISKAVLS